MIIVKFPLICHLKKNTTNKTHENSNLKFLPSLLKTEARRVWAAGPAQHCREGRRCLPNHCPLARVRDAQLQTLSSKQVPAPGQDMECDHQSATAQAPAHQNMSETFLTLFSKRNFKSRNVFLSRAATFRQADS